MEGGSFFNTFRLDMDGIYKIQIWRDEEYMLRAKLIGNCVITDQGDEGALERGVIVQSDLKVCGIIRIPRS